MISAKTKISGAHHSARGKPGETCDRDGTEMAHYATHRQTFASRRGMTHCTVLRNLPAYLHVAEKVFVCNADPVDTLFEIIQQLSDNTYTCYSRNRQRRT